MAAKGKPGHVLLGHEGFVFRRHFLGVANHPVKFRQAAGLHIAVNPFAKHGRGTAQKHGQAVIGRLPGHVDQDVNAVSANFALQLVVAHGRNLHPVIDVILEHFAVLVLLARVKMRVGKDLEIVAEFRNPLAPENRLHEVGHGMSSEIRGDIAKPDLARPWLDIERLLRRQARLDRVFVPVAEIFPEICPPE